MANNNDFSATYRDKLAPKAIKRLVAKMQGLEYITQDISEEIVDKNKTISIELQTEDFIANDWNDVTGIQSQSFKTNTVLIELNKHKEVTFELSDVQMREVQTQNVVPDLFNNAVNALAKAQVIELYKLYKKVYNFSGTGSSNAFKTDDIFEGEKILFDVLVETDPVAAVTSRAYTDLAHELKDGSKTSDATSENALRNKELGDIANTFVFRDQLLKDVYHTAGTASQAGAAWTVDTALNAAPAGSTAIDVFDGSLNGATFLEGDLISIDGHDQTYVITADATAGAGNPPTAGVATISISPALTEDLTSGQAVTVMPSHAVNLMYGKEFAVHVMRQLDKSAEELGLGGVGSIQQNIVDPRTKTSMRMESFRDPKLKTHFFTFDVLFNVELLDAKYAVRLLNS